MKNSISILKLWSILILLPISLCQSTDFVCQSFNQKAKFLEQYCDRYNGAISIQCPAKMKPIEPCQVERLKIGGCDGDIVWNAVNKFENLHALDLSDSNYQVLNWLNGATFSLSRLLKLNASHNELSYLLKFGQNISELREIDLSYNKLHRIDSTSFAEHNKLATINLSHNELRHLSSDAFKSVHNLELIDLSDNYFREVPIFPYNYELKAIHFEHNPIFYLNCPRINAAKLYLSWDSVLSFYGRGTCDDMQIRIVPNTKYEALATQINDYKLHCNAHSFKRLYTFIAGPAAFKNVTQLLPYFSALITNLDLSGNFVGKLNASTFDRFDHLLSLALSRTELPDFDFGQLKNYRLKTLDLSDNGLKYIDNISYLERLFTLMNFNVAGNPLRNAPQLIQYLRPSIKELNLSGTLLGQLNDTTFMRLDALETLILCNANLSMLNFSAFEPLSGLKNLDISYNNLKPVNISHFTVFSTLKQLNKLNLAYCKLENASNWIPALGETIKELDLAGNKVGQMNSHTFAMLNNLEFLNLSDTNLMQFNFAILKDLTNLQVFDISYNHLKTADVVRLPNALKHLYFEGNDLIQIDNCTAGNFPAMESMSIGNNQLSCLTLRRFLSQWRHLHFIGNSLGQKHGKYCKCSVHGIFDFLQSVYGTVRFW